MDSSPPKSSFIEVNGVRLHVQDWGGEGAPIVLLHATGFLGWVYRAIAEQLRAAGHVYSFDQRGHGDSGPSPDGEYNWELTMRDLEGFIEKMRLKGARGFGHSAGATAIGALGAIRPDLISRAVLIEPVIFEHPEAPELGWRNPFRERTLKRRRIFDSVDAMFENFDRKPPYDTWRKEMLRDYCEHGTRPTSDGRRELKCTPETEARIYDTSRDFDGLGMLLENPTALLVLFGARSDSLGITLADHVGRALRNGRVMTVPDAGHFLAMEQPDLVARRAIEFFSA
jgi:lipase